MTQTQQMPETSPEGLESGARDWMEVERRRVRGRIERYVEAVGRRSGRRYEYTFPRASEAAFRMLAGLGYDANRKHYDYCIRHGLMDTPAKECNRLLWKVESIIDFAMQLERMRYWLPGRHDEKKTAWELQAEVEATGKRWDLDTKARRMVDGLDADAAMNLLAETEDGDLRIAMSDYVAITLCQYGLAMDEVSEALLEQIVEESDAAQRRALVAAMRKHFNKRVRR